MLPWSAVVYSRSLLVALGAAYLVFACGESATDPSGVPEPPTLLSITGRANGTGPDGGTVDCVLDLTMELRTETFRDSNVVEYAGVHGGHVGRSVVDSTGAGMAFFADVYWPETMARFSQDSVELILGPDDPTEGRFWRELRRLAGARSDTDLGSGHWICAPLDITEGGWVDTAFTAEGDWRLELWPQEGQPNPRLLP
jgi:hypothetical protein